MSDPLAAGVRRAAPAAVRACGFILLAGCAVALLALCAPVASGPEADDPDRRWHIEALTPQSPRATTFYSVEIHPDAERRSAFVAWTPPPGGGPSQYLRYAPGTNARDVRVRDSSEIRALRSAAGVGLDLGDGARVETAGGSWFRLVGRAAWGEAGVEQVMALRTPEGALWLELSAARVPDSARRLRSVRWADGEPLAGGEQVAATYRHGGTPAVRVFGGAVHILAGETEFTTEVPTEGSAQVISAKSVARHWFSSDAGQHWASAPPLDAGGAPPIWAVSGDRLYAITGGQAFEWLGSQWGPAVALDSVGGEQMLALAGPDGDSLFWISRRNRKTDRRWRNPLGGLPWSDDPDWSNNDIHWLPPGQLQRALAGQKVRALRITPVGGLVRSLGGAVLDGEIHLFWSGQEQITKHRDPHHGDRIFHASLRE